MKICDNCTGCMCCANICPFGAIEIGTDKYGFYVPKVTTEKCTKCGLCKLKCPQNHTIPKENNLKKVYASWSIDNNIRQNSTSGGLSYIIAEYIIKKGGIVVGVVFDEKFQVVHKCIDNIEELSKMRGSKYVQSYIGYSFKEIKTYLDNGKIVLFTGTACQISGLNSFLKKEYVNLITLDVLCHGAPSPLFFKDYKDNMEKKGKINQINFRYKKPSWTIFSMKIDYQNNNKYIKITFKDKFLRAFLNDYITNPSCSNCKYASANRVSDITLADFWGYISEKRKYRNTEKGISLIIVNTEKGKNLIEKNSDKIILIDKTFNEAAEGNQCLRKPFKKNKNFDNFWIDYNEKGYEYVCNKYLENKKDTLKRKTSRFFNDHAYILPKSIRNLLMNLRRVIK